MEIKWDDHWANNLYDPLSNIKNPKIWSDFVWKHSLEVLEEKINIKLADQKDFKNISFLECGAGTASVTRHLKLAYDFDVIALDNEVESISLIGKLADKDKINIKTIHSSIENIPLDSNSVDIVYLGGVLEYVEDVDICLREINRILKEDGIIIFMVVPNVLNIQVIGNVLMYLKGLGGLRKNSQLKLVPNNARKWRSIKYIESLKRQSFDNITIDYLIPYPQLPLPVFLKFSYAFLLNITDNIIRKFNKWNFFLKEYFTISFLITAKKGIDDNRN